MKTLKGKAIAMTLALAYGVLALNAHAQSDEQVLNSDPIDVDGYVKEQQATDMELENVKSELSKQKGAIKVNKEKSKKYQELGETTEELAEVTEDYIEDKKEAQSTISEYNKKIECLMQESKSKDCAKYVRNRGASDEVTTAQAAPVVAATVAPEEKKSGAFEEIKATPYFGSTNFMGKQESLQALGGGVRVESNISDRASIGLGIGYTTMKTRDFSNQMNGYSWYNTYQDYYGNNGREIEYSAWNLNMYGKFFLSKGERFRPYIGGGLGMSRSTLNYTQNGSYNPQNYGYNNYNGNNFGGEKLTTNSVNAQVVAGTEVIFTKSIGLDLMVQYSRGFGNSFNNQNAQNPSNSIDQQRLISLSQDINSSNALSVFAGMLIIF